MVWLTCGLSRYVTSPEPAIVACSVSFAETEAREDPCSVTLTRRESSLPAASSPDPAMLTSSELARPAAANRPLPPAAHRLSRAAGQ
jgi:hypothetical protein